MGFEPANCGAKVKGTNDLIIKADLRWTIFWTIVSKIRGETVVLISTWFYFVARMQKGTPAFLNRI